MTTSAVIRHLTGLGHAPTDADWPAVVRAALANLRNRKG